MVELSDELLIAYVDGELDQNTAAAVTAALTEDSAARETVEIFRQSAALVREAFNKPLNEEIPARLLKPFHEAPSGDGTIVDFPNRRAKKPIWSIQRMAMPLAASIALLIGLGIGFEISQDLGLSPSSGNMDMAGAISPASSLHGALEKSPSGHSVAWRDGPRDESGQITLLLTFKDPRGRYCREYEAVVTGATGASAAHGIACRASDGTWLNEISVAMPLRPVQDGSYTPAGRGDEALEVVVDRLMVEPALDAETEKGLLGSGWQ